MTNPQDPNLKARTGRHVEIEIVYENGQVERLSLDLVPDAAADFERGFLGESTPLARAITGKVAGSTLPYRLGDARLVRILSVSATLNAQPTDLTGRREETTRKAVADSDRTSLIIYASSMSNKWGDLDPASLDSQEEQSQPGPNPPDPEKKS